MSAIERGHDVERVATVHPFPSHVTPDPAPPAVHLPSRSQVADLFVPPDIWSEKRPSLRDVWLYARYGRWTQQTGILRVLGCLDAMLIVLPAHAALYLALWLIERPARRFVAATVAALIILTF